MMQSNMVCVTLALVSVANIPEMSWVQVLASIVLGFDALIGTAIFGIYNWKEISKNVQLIKPISGLTKSGIAIEFVELDNEFSRI